MTIFLAFAFTQNIQGAIAALSVFRAPNLRQPKGTRGGGDHPIFCLIDRPGRPIPSLITNQNPRTSTHFENEKQISLSKKRDYVISETG